jgi:serine/threonine protein kinase
MIVGIPVLARRAMADSATATLPEPFGPYLLTEHLGRGGLADVFKARAQGPAGFSRTVVIKRILKVYAKDQRFVDLFLNEARLAAQLSHPSLVHIHELGQIGGVYFIAMEYVPGVNLLALLRAARERGLLPLPPLLCAHVLREVLLGLAHAHEHTDEQGRPQPIIHRDVSPQNILLRRDGQVKLLDFGSARAVRLSPGEARTSLLQGQIGYMAPEQLRSGACTPQTDLFSAGVVLHELLTGHRLFKGQTEYELMTSVVSAPIPPPSLYNPAIPLDLERITLRALSRDPRGRYQSAAQMARELDILLQDARFSVDQGAAWLRALGPAEPGQDEVPSGRHGDAPDARTPRPHAWDVELTPAAQAPRAAAAQLPASPSPLPSPLPAPLPSPLPFHDEPEDESGPREGGAQLLVAAWFLAGVTMVLLLVWIGGKLRQPAQDEERAAALRVPPGDLRPAEAAPAPAPAQAPAPAPAQAPAPVQAPVPAQQLALDSEPSGAAVYAGPKRLGKTPMQLDLSRAPALPLQVTLVLPGWRDLTYDITRQDLPELTLRLTRAAARPGKPATPGQPSSPGPGPGPGQPAPGAGVQGARQAPAPPAEQPARGLRVKSVDDEDGAPGEGP